MENAIEICDLTKSFHSVLTGEDVIAVDHLTLDIHRGEIFGFLGPNGAGKTTTIKMLLGLIFPTSGTASILGYPPGDIEVKRKISYLPESPYFYEHLSGYEVLDFYATLFGIPAAERKKKVDELLDLVGLSDNKHKRLRHYSKGMLQRIGLAQALINDPDLLFLDEPTSGLDPIAHLDIRDMILRLRDEGRTVFLSSHQLSDVEMVCDRVSILDRGKLMRVGSLKEMLAGKSVEIRAERVRDDVFEKIKAHSSDAFTVDGAIRVRVEQSFVNETVQMIMQTGGEITAVIPGKRTLEDIFIETVREGTVS
ncbi:MAG: ABC transporter ATP-binding protein [Armatimonadota bacterium]|jgi:ABC-2 type transport system ATP-binding protein